MCPRKHWSDLLCMAACGHRHGSGVGPSSLLVLLAALLPTAARAQENVLPFVKAEPKELELPSVGEELGEEVLVTCGTPIPPNDRVRGVIRLTLQRDLEEERSDISNPQVLAKAATENVNTGDTQLVAVGGKANWTVRGGVSLRTPKGSIGVRILKPGCWDAGRYSCRLDYYKDDAAKQAAFATASTYLSVAPSDLRVNVTPSVDSGQLQENVQMNITCTGNVGSDVSDYTIVWVWQYRDRSTAAKTWKDYDGEAEDVSEPMDPEKESCFWRRSSMLSRVLTKVDATRDYRCYLRRMKGGDLEEVDFEQSAQSVSIPNFLKKSPLELSKVALVGIVFGLVAILCALGFCCIFFSRRKRSQKEAQQVILHRRQSMDERRKNLAIVVEKRKSLLPADKAAEGEIADTLLAKLKTTDGKKPVVKPDLESSLEESSLAAETTTSELTSDVDESTASAVE
ncbi:uncharacterized protein LOC143291413 [Babylonia areolata]|uniref:uncharacterized protein LOC143291413 n=1 Tax=Babylonia areolata TaxID=304850 RepID=UPI003FD1336E